MKAPSSHRLPEQGLVPIRTVSSLTGVNSVTLRAWERRYDLIKPVRTPKGHRLYTMADVALIQQVVVLLDNGMSIGQVRRVLEADTTSQELAHEGDRGQALDLWPHYQHQLLQAIAAFDDGVLNDLYTEILSLYPVDIVTSRLIVPLLRELGERWVEGTGSIAEEHFFSVFLRNKLGARFHHLSRAPQGPKLLAACLPGEQHEVGLLLFALAALDRNYSIVLLGSNTPLAELPAVVDAGCCPGHRPGWISEYGGFYGRTPASMPDGHDSGVHRRSGRQLPSRRHSCCRRDSAGGRPGPGPAPD